MHCAYPQHKRRKETALAQEVADSGRRGGPAPAARRAGTPRGARIAGERKGPEIIRALVDGGAGVYRTIHQEALGYLLLHWSDCEVTPKVTPHRVGLPLGPVGVETGKTSSVGIAQSRKSDYLRIALPVRKRHRSCQ